MKKSNLKPGAVKGKRINARISEAQWKELEKMSAKSDLPISHFVRTAVKNFLLDK